MINVNLYTADPTGEHGEYRDAVYQYAENMNRMYQLFHVSFHVVEYSGKLTKDRDGKFQVKKMQNAVLPAIRTSGTVIRPLPAMRLRVIDGCRGMTCCF